MISQQNGHPELFPSVLFLFSMNSMCLAPLRGRAYRKVTQAAEIGDLAYEDVYVWGLGE